MTIIKLEFEHAKPYIKQVSGFPDFIHKIEYEYLAYKEFPSTAPNTPDGKCTLLQPMISTCTYSDPSASDYDSSNPYIGITSFTQEKVSGMFSVAYDANKTAWDNQINAQFDALRESNGTNDDIEPGTNSTGGTHFTFGSPLDE